MEKFAIGCDNVVVSMEVSDIIAIIAIFVSIGGLILQFVWEHLRKKKEQKTLLYKEAYRSIFVDEIPIAQQKIHYNGQRLTGLLELEECMSKIRLKSYFFMYVDENFRKEIFQQSQNIEDFLVNLEDCVLTNEQYREKYEELQNKLQKMYDTVMRKFY